jgi:hypothetical protein
MLSGMKAEQADRPVEAGKASAVQVADDRANG